jgi:hypothetical protein
MQILREVLHHQQKGRHLLLDVLVQGQSPNHVHRAPDRDLEHHLLNRALVHHLHVQDQDLLTGGGIPLQDLVLVLLEEGTKQLIVLDTQLSLHRSRSRTPESTTLFVDKLTRNVNKEHLQEIFGKYGKLKNVDLNWDARANLPRGSAYIEFFDRAEAEKAQLHMDGVRLNTNLVNFFI